MALRKTETFSGEVLIQSGGSLISTGSTNQIEKVTYCKVNNVMGGKAVVMAKVQVIDEASGSEIAQREFVFAPDMDGPNFIKQAYEHMKTLPEFADAIDC